MKPARSARIAGVALAALVVLAVPFALVRAAAPLSPAGAMAAAANALLTTLSPEQQKRAAWAFDDGARQRFFFVPKPLVPRAGLPFKQMTPPQRELARALLKAGLGQAGYLKVSQIIELEPVLRELEKDPIRRDPENYYFWIFGRPEPKGTWGWKVEGHHVSLNVTIVDGVALATVPQFLGANPAEVREGPLAGRRVLHAEEDLGRELALSFDAKTRAEVVFDAKALPEIVSFDASKVDPLPPAGLPASRMTPAQKELLRKLLAEYASAMPAPLASERLAKVDKAGFDQVRFAWAGGLKRGDPHYYRVQGPTFLVEFDNTQNNANHAHSVWRDFDGDFGRDLLREHLRSAHQQ
jgi:hypothetical protein